MFPNWSLKIFRMFVRVRELDLHGGLLLDPVAVHVDRFEDALGEVVLDGCRELGRFEPLDLGHPVNAIYAVRP